MRVAPPRRWDETVDVVVVGCGFAGAMAAIAAHDRGARVAILERMPDPGGISVCSFGGVRVAASARDAFAYLKRTNLDTAPDDVLRALAQGMAALPRRLAALARPLGIALVNRPGPGNYPLRATTRSASSTSRRSTGSTPRALTPRCAARPAAR